MKWKVTKATVEITAMVILTAVLLVVIDYYNGLKDYKKTFLLDSINTSAHTAEVAGICNKTCSSVQTECTDVCTRDERGYNSGEPKIKTEPVKMLKDKSLVNILFLGIDKMEDREELLGVYRTDTIAIASINLDTKKVNILSIPRDTYVYLPCTGKMDKINHAYAFGDMNEKGINSTIEVVNSIIKYTNIHYYFSLDMDPIPQIVDSIGGVELDVEIDMKTYGADLSKGRQILNGQKAFDYIHWRFSGNGDIDRIFRQQKFVKAVINKLKDDNDIVNTVKLVLDYKKNIQTNMSAKQLLSLASLINEVNKDDVSFSSLPGIGQYINGVSYWVLDAEGCDKVLESCFELGNN